MDCGYTESFVESEYREKVRQMRQKAEEKKATAD
jgi:hypothetical protein